MPERLDQMSGWNTTSERRRGTTPFQPRRALVPEVLPGRAQTDRKARIKQQLLPMKNKEQD